MEAAERKHLWLYIWAFVLLGLVGAGAALYEPLRLSYAIHKVRQGLNPAAFYGPSYWPSYGDKWLLICLEGAKKGNRPAMETVIDALPFYVTGTKSGVTVTNSGAISLTLALSTVESAFWPAASAQPELFFELLDKRSDEKVRASLIEAADDGIFLDAGFAYSVNTSAADLLQKMKASQESSDPARRRAAQAAVEFIRRRFAEELAEAEKAAGQEAKP